MEEGKCIIVSAPSGAGKTTIVQRLLKMDLGLEFSISATSREKRETEISGKDYLFLSSDAFKSKIEDDLFLEFEEVYPNQFYGTLRSEIHRIWSKGQHVIFDVDVVGGLNLKKIFGEQALAVFIMPPSIDSLKERLINRRTESPEKLKLRLDKAEKELSFASEFDKIVVNDQLSHAIGDAEKLIQEFANN
ncbi:MAG: guanylate kinase [Flavobacteriales bacterium]|nr:guanylate kinase [Flavobacteriales bacterium]